MRRLVTSVVAKEQRHVASSESPCRIPSSGSHHILLGANFAHFCKFLLRHYCCFVNLVALSIVSGVARKLHNAAVEGVKTVGSEDRATLSRDANE